jgi:hypothetical protein
MARRLLTRSWALGPAVGLGLLQCTERRASAKEAQPEPEDVAQRNPWERKPLGHPCTQKGKFVPGCHELKVFSGRSHPKLAAEIGDILG